MELVGQGRHADVFALDDDRVLRRYRDAARDTTVQVEAMRAAVRAGYPAPRVLDAAGPEIVMERVQGRSLLADMVRRPWLIRRHAAVLVELHERLHLIEAPSILPAPVGDGAALLHLDLQPENVLLTAKGPVVLDWEWAARGPAQADLAHTLLQLDTSEIPGGRARRAVSAFGRGLFTRRFAELAGGRSSLEGHLLTVARYRLAQRALTDRERDRIDEVLRGFDASE